MTTDLELFKQALNEGLELRIQSTIDSCTEEIVCSKEHIAACKAIIRGTYKNRPLWSDAKIKIAAIIAAATMLLAGCTAIYKDEIKTFIKHIYEEYIEITFGDSGSGAPQSIEEIYELTYVPKGYALKTEFNSKSMVSYTFESENGETLTFDQCVLNGSSFNFDNERSDSILITVGKNDVYFTNTNKNYSYIWNDGKYALIIISTKEISYDELLKVIDGITSK